MSRTIRRKNFETEHADGYGAWHYCDHVSSWEHPDHPAVGNFGRVRIDKHAEPKRWKQAWWSVHRESKSCNERSPGRYYRQKYGDALKTLSKRELFKFEADPDYEVIIPSNPQNCWWDWS